MYLRDSQVSIMPKYTSNDIGGLTHKYSSDNIVLKGGAKRNKTNRKHKKSVKKNGKKQKKSRKNVAQ